MKLNVIIEVVTFSPLKLPMNAMPTELKLCSFAWAPTTPHPRPSYTTPSPEIRKLEEDRQSGCVRYRLESAVSAEVTILLYSFIWWEKLKYVIIWQEKENRLDTVLVIYRGLLYCFLFFRFIESHDKMASYTLVNRSLSFIWWTVMSIVDILNTWKKMSFLFAFFWWLLGTYAYSVY